jgi:NADH-quinone oxidoreductase subunit N
VTLDYHALLPELILGTTVVVVLVIDLFPVEKYWAAVAGLIGMFLAFIPVLTLGFCESLSFCDDTGVRVLFSGSYVIDPFSLVMKGLFLIAAFVALLIAVGYLESGRFYEGEYYFLLIASVFGAFVMASSRDLITLFVALELVTAPTFLLAGWRKGDARSNEAAMKFFIIGVISSSVLLFGMSLVYGTTGELTFNAINAASADLGDARPLFALGLVFTLLGFAFKVSAVPFHFWTPDVYEGSPTPVSAYLSVVSKTAGFVGLLTFTYIAFANHRDIWGPLLAILAAASIILGNVVALKQTNVIRLLGYSSIAQAGFMLVPLGAAAAEGATGAELEDAFFATVTYLLIYAFMNLGAFAVAIAVRNRIGSFDLADWGGLSRYAPGLATLVAIFFFSLAGIPPLAGWFAKLVMFRAAVSLGGPWGITLAVIAVLGSVVGLVYYAKVAKSAWFDPLPDGVVAEDLAAPAWTPGLQLALGITALAVIVMGIFPGLISKVGEISTDIFTALG